MPIRPDERVTDRSIRNRGSDYAIYMPVGRGFYVAWFVRARGPVPEKSRTARPA